MKTACFQMLKDRICQRLQCNSLRRMYWERNIETFLDLIAGFVRILFAVRTNEGLYTCRFNETVN